MPGKPTVLIVDDHLDFSDSLAEYLREIGFDVVASSNGREALELLNRGLRPCAILLDLMMPVMDGWDFRAEQRRTPAIEAIPVAVLSACGLSKKAVLTRLGDVEYIEKPPAMARIVDFVERKCGGSPRS